MPMKNITSISIPRKDLVFAKTFDNSLRQVAKQGSGFEGCLEHSKVSERWSDITDAFANEKAEAEARAAEMTKNSDEAEQEDVVTAELNKIRSAPTTFAENSPSYWKAVANRTVRTYVTLLPEGKTLQGMSSCISQVSWLKNLNIEVGSASVMIYLDPDHLGETLGPLQQRNLRKRFSVQEKHLRRLVQGAMLGRGAQMKTLGSRFVRFPSFPSSTILQSIVKQ